MEVIILCLDVSCHYCGDLHHRRRHNNNNSNNYYYYYCYYLLGTYYIPYTIVTHSAYITSYYPFEVHTVIHIVRARKPKLMEHLTLNAMHHRPCFTARYIIQFHSHYRMNNREQLAHFGTNFSYQRTWHSFIQQVFLSSHYVSKRSLCLLTGMNIV